MVELSLSFLMKNKSDTGHTHIKTEITDFNHTHTKTNITDFSHTHTKTEITDFSHTHTMSQITDLPNLESGSIPSGFIGMWSGSSTNIPNGWFLCNGQNNTPDLRNRFILGAGGSYAVGVIGGETTHTLTINELPKFNAVTSANSLYSFANGADNGMLGVQSVNVSSIGGGMAHNTMPPYYALCFIMKS